MYDIEKLKKILTTHEYRIIDDNGKILPPSNPIYQRISKDMDSKILVPNMFMLLPKIIEMAYMISYWLSMDF